MILISEEQVLIHFGVSYSIVDQNLVA